MNATRPALIRASIGLIHNFFDWEELMSLEALRPLNRSAVRDADDLFYAQHPEYVVGGRRLPLSECQRRDGRARAEWLRLYAQCGGQVAQSTAERCRQIHPPEPALNQCAENRGILVVYVTRAGQPLAEALVEILSAGQVIGSGYTGADALVRFELPAGSYNVVVDADWSIPVNSARQFANVQICQESFLQVQLHALARPQLVRRLTSVRWSEVRHVTRSEPSSNQDALRDLIANLADQADQGQRTYALVDENWVVVRVTRRLDEQHIYTVIQSHRKSHTVEYEWGWRTPTVEVIDIMTETGSNFGNHPPRRTVFHLSRDEVWNQVGPPERPMSGRSVGNIDGRHLLQRRRRTPEFRNPHDGARRRPVGY